MKKFILHTSLFIALILLSVLAIFSFVDGHSDSYYLKLSSPKKSNLILGTSKSAQGLQPAVLENILNKQFYNYSFSNFASPYGRVYLNSIKNKLDTTSRDNTFILTVDAWSICSKSENPNDSLHFRENKSFLDAITNVCSKPNYKYLINYFEGSYYNILLKASPAFLHNDGWLEITLNNDSINVQTRTAFTLNDYNEKLSQYKLSSLRLQYLLKTINYLKKYGKVYLVQLPVHPQLSKIEKVLIPDFNAVIQPAIEQSDGYLDMLQYNQMYSYTDGVHLDTKSGIKVSTIIANWIKK